MGLDYFPGYEFMVFVLAWIIYIGIPVGSIWGVRQFFPNPKALLVSPVDFFNCFSSVLLAFFKKNISK